MQHHPPVSTPTTDSTPTEGVRSLLRADTLALHTIEDPLRQFFIKPPEGGWIFRSPNSPPPDISSISRYFSANEGDLASVALFLVEERGICPSRAGSFLRAALTAGWDSDVEAGRKFKSWPAGERAQALALRFSFVTSDMCPYFFFGTEPAIGNSFFTTEQLDEITLSPNRENASRDVQRAALRELTELAELLPEDASSLGRYELRVLKDLTYAQLGSLGVRIFTANPQDSSLYMTGELYRQTRTGIMNCGSDFGGW